MKIMLLIIFIHANGGVSHDALRTASMEDCYAMGNGFVYAAYSDDRQTRRVSVVYTCTEVSQ